MRHTRRVWNGLPVHTSQWMCCSVNSNGCCKCYLIFLIYSEIIILGASYNLQHANWGSCKFMKRLQLLNVTLYWNLNLLKLGAGRGTWQIKDLENLRTDVEIFEPFSVWHSLIFVCLKLFKSHCYIFKKVSGLLSKSQVLPFTNVWLTEVVILFKIICVWLLASKCFHVLSNPKACYRKK